MRQYRSLLLALLVMALLAPVGLYLPQILKAGSAWGEWGIGEVRRMIGHVPAGMEKTAEPWKAPMPGYGPRGQDDPSSSTRGFYYLLSAFLGAAACGAGAWLLARRLARRGGDAANGRGTGAS